MRLDALCCFISGFITIAPPASAQNLLHNPGFEEVYGGSSLFFPSYWANGSPSAISSSEVARSGEWSAQINSTASLQPGAAQGDGFFPGSVPTIAAAPGLEYEFSVYALHLSEDTLAGSGHRVGLTLGFYGADAFSVGSVFELVFDGTTDDGIPAEDIWHRRSVSMVAPENTIGVWLELRIFTDDTNRNNGTAYFDDAALRVVPAPGAAALFGLGALTARRRR
jgi:hypothetical protein